MSEHRATIRWTTAVASTDYTKGRYSREHAWEFDGGITVPGSASPATVRAPWSIEAAVDPEEAFVASIASCHMLTFLYLTARAGFALAGYTDHAVGMMTKGDNGVPWVSKVTLRPELAWVGDRQPTAAELADLHHHAHEQCFISNSIKTEVVVE
jgi:organic hydroperoxide reductase OsmC/OhrA